MITIELQGVNVQVIDAQTPAGPTKIVIYTDAQSGIRVAIPHDENAARVVAAGLENRPAIQIANGMPGQNGHPL